MSTTSATPLRVALDVSALRDHGSAAAEFVRFVWAACDLDAGLEITTWTSTWAPHGQQGERRRAARLAPARWSAVLGTRATSRWAVPRADVAFLASGQGPIVARTPGIVSVLDVRGLRASEGRAARRRRSRLLRAASEGVVVHAVTQDLADALVADVGLSRSEVTVAHPGVELAEVPDGAASAGVVVLGGTDAQGDQTICDLLRARGEAGEVVSPNRPPLVARCAVLASPGEGFPFGALRLLAAGVPLVAIRTPTTTELFEGAAELVDPHATDEIVDAALSITRDESSRSIAVAAGRIRAGDFSWSRRASDMADLVRRAAAKR
jgi:hypothetical protein